MFKDKKDKAIDEGGDGLVLFDTVPDAIRAEKILKEAGYVTKMVSPPAELRKSCDLALKIHLVEQAGIEWVLKQAQAFYSNIAPLGTTSVDLLDNAKPYDLGKWIMIRSGNMKLTYRKESGLIVNISGGGCSDVPYLHAKMLGKTLTEVSRPRDAVGATL